MNSNYNKLCFVRAMKIASEIALKTANDHSNLKCLMDSVERGIHNCNLDEFYSEGFYSDMNTLYTELFGEEWDSPYGYAVV